MHTVQQHNFCSTQGENMIVRKVRNQNKVGKIILSKAEVDSVKRLGVPIETYVKERLLQIAKQRKWTWYPYKVTP
jgi:hypothetical protein